MELENLLWPQDAAAIAKAAAAQTQESLFLYKLAPTHCLTGPVHFPLTCILIMVYISPWPLL